MDERDEKEMLQRLTIVEQSAKSAHHRLDRMDELIQNIQTLTVEMRHMREDISSYATRIEAIEDKPAKRWDGVVSGILGALAGGLGTYVVTMIIGG